MKSKDAKESNDERVETPSPTVFASSAFFRLLHPLRPLRPALQGPKAPEGRRTPASRRVACRLLIVAAVSVLAALALDWLFPLPLPRLTDDLATVVVDRADRPLRAFPAPSGAWIS